MTKQQTSPFILLGVGVLASIGYFYVGPKLFGSKGSKLTDSPFSPFPPGQAQQMAVTSQGPPLPAVLPQGKPPMGPQTMLPPPRPPVNNSPNITLQNGAVPMSPQGMPLGLGLPNPNFTPSQNPQGAMMPPPYPPIKPNPNMMFSGATFPENVPGLTYGFPMTGF